MAVDLFSGRNRAICMARFMGGMTVNPLGHEGIRDLRMALDFLAIQPSVDAARLGAIGFCMGGGFAIAWASTDERLKVIAPFYGPAPRRLAAARLCPVVGSYPAGDITTRSARRLTAALAATQIPHDIRIYAGARHSFCDDTKPARFHAEAAEDGWRRTLAFFQEHIGGTRATLATSERTAGVLAPPPLLYLAAFGLGLLLQTLAPWRFAAPAWARVAGVALIGLAMGLVRWAFLALRRAGTDGSPYRVSTALVTAGPFRISRNPVYVGMAGMYLGAIAVVGSLWPAAVMPPLLAVMHLGVVRREEEYLAQRFGAAYGHYRARVRRWL